MPAPAGNQTGSMTATGDVILGNAGSAGVGWYVIQITGTWAGTVKFQGTLDQSTYVDLAFGSVGSTAPGTPVTSVTANGIYVVDAKGLSLLQLDWTRTSGTLVYWARAVNG